MSIEIKKRRKWKTQVGQTTYRYFLLIRGRLGRSDD
jgi:hypothetical protein